MRKACLVALFLMACGKDECDNYSIVACSRWQLCIGPVDQDKCVEESNKVLHAAKATQEACVDVAEAVKKMSCQEFKTFVNR